MPWCYTGPYQHLLFNESDSSSHGVVREQMFEYISVLITENDPTGWQTASSNLVAANIVITREDHCIRRNVAKRVFRKSY